MQCRWILLDSTQNLPTRTTRTHQQFTSSNIIHQRRRKQLHSSIPLHLSSTKSWQNHLGKNLQITNACKPVPEIHITESNICKTKSDHSLIRPSRQYCFKRKRQNWRKASHLSCITKKRLSKGIHPKSTTGEKNSQESAQKKNLKQTKSINLPYIQRVSESLKRTLNKHNIKATFYTQTTLRSLLLKPKDPIPKEDRNNAVYQLNCKDCEAVYVGETTEHKSWRTQPSSSLLVKEVTLQSTAGNTIMTFTRNIKKYWTLRKTGKQEPSRRQPAQKKTSIISMEYPTNYQIFGNQYYKRAKQTKQQPKLQHHQT